MSGAPIYCWRFGSTTTVGEEQIPSSWMLRNPLEPPQRHQLGGEPGVIYLGHDPELGALLEDDHPTPKDSLGLQVP